MANEEHLAKLKEGVEAWNDWRRAQPKVVPDLSRAEIEKVNLPGANLSRVSLDTANLQNAIPDFREWKNLDLYVKEFEKLLRDLRTEEAAGRSG
jgi:uncharacterized protein YjbI with pentapeptide repeats